MQDLFIGMSGLTPSVLLGALRAQRQASSPSPASMPSESNHLFWLCERYTSLHCG